MAARSEVQGKAPHWLLELDLGGRVFRFADSPVSVTRANGTAVLFRAGLVPISVSRSASSVAVEVASDEASDWARLEAEGVDIASGRATLYRWWDGQNLNAAEVVRTGRVDRPEYGPLPQPLTFSIVDIDWQDQTIVPSVEMVIDETTWPVTAPYELLEESEGAAYPLVIGYPGWKTLVGGLVPSYAPASPAYLVEYHLSALYWHNSKLLIAGHEIEATNVIVYDMSDEQREARAVQYTTDLRGRRVAYVSFSSGIRAYEGHSYAVAFLDHTGYGGGLVWRGEVVRGAGTLIEYLLTENLFATDRAVKARIDVGAQKAQSAILDRWKIDAVIAEGTDVLSWIRAHLLPILPMKEVQGPDGIYFCAWRYDATAADAVMHLDLDRGCELVSRTGATAEVKNEFRLRYRRTASGDYVSQRVLTAEADATDPTVRGSYLCRASQAREQARTGVSGARAKEFSSDVLWDHASAMLTLEMWALRDALPGVPVAIRGGPEIETLRRGDVVTVTSAGMYWSARIAIVEDITSGDGPAEVDLLVLADPQRVRRSVG